MTHSTLPAARSLLAFTLVALGFTAGTAQAAEAIKGDAAAGATKAATCTACHGLNGNSANPEWPVIAGQNAAYVRDQVIRIRDNKRPVPLMQPMVQNLTDQDIADLAAFFSAQTPTGNEADPSYWKAGQQLYRNGDAARGIPACTACHGPIGRGVPAAAYPALQAQHSVYTVKQLNDYATESRYSKDAGGKPQSGPNAPIMYTIAARLTPEERRDVASYIQGIR
ncbi:MAG: cytochrome c4 [Steroidobacteraceae bacterium]